MLRSVKEYSASLIFRSEHGAKFAAWLCLWLYVCGFGLLPSLAGATAEGFSAGQRPDFEQAQIAIYPHIGKAPLFFQVELAKTRDKRSYGLMFSPALRVNTGMLFIFDDSQPRAFWMKNTPISLDILFFDANGQLISMIENAKPHSLAHLKSTGPAQYVLEIGGGEAARIGFGTGTRLQLPFASGQK